MISIIMAVAKVDGKLLFGDTSGGLPWGHIPADMAEFVRLTQPKEGRIFVCSESTYATLPQSVIKRLNPFKMELLLNSVLEPHIEYVVLGGRRLIDSALPWADNIYISEIGGVTEHKDSFIYLRESTVKKLSDAELESSCWYGSFDSTTDLYPDKTKPYLLSTYLLSRNKRSQ